MLLFNKLSKKNKGNRRFKVCLIVLHFLIFFCTEISIDVVEMIKFRGLSLSVDGGNGSLILNQISFPPSLFGDALTEKLASGAWFCC